MKPMEHPSPIIPSKDRRKTRLARAWEWLKAAWSEESDFEGRQF